jgi:hypothetical protein
VAERRLNGWFALLLITVQNKVTRNANGSVMAKTNTERQAAFRDKMRQEGKQALHVWVTPEQATQIQAFLGNQPPQSLQVTKSRTAPQPLHVTGPTRRIVLPPIPGKTPPAIVRELKEAASRLQKKQGQIEKLNKDAAAIEKRFRQTIDDCKRL